MGGRNEPDDIHGRLNVMVSGDDCFLVFLGGCLFFCGVCLLLEAIVWALGGLERETKRR